MDRKIIEKDTKKYLKTAVIYENMNLDIYNELLDFSPAVITLIKALENEFYQKIYKKIVQYCEETYGKSNLHQWPGALVVKGRFSGSLSNSVGD